MLVRFVDNSGDMCIKDIFLSYKIRSHCPRKMARDKGFFGVLCLKVMFLFVSK